MLGLVFVTCILLSWCKAEITFGPTNSMLDPNRITWWKSKWAPAPIILSSNNSGATGVTLTFYFTPATSITDGVFEVTFPANFVPPTGASTVSGQVYYKAGVNYTGGNDTTEMLTGVTNPTSGAYGPFALRTRYTILGQQVDVNLNFGCVYITAPAGALGAITVSVVGAPDSGTLINQSGKILSFKFTIAVSLWRYDTFVITSNSYWSLSSGVTCSSADYGTHINNFNGTNSANPHSLQCVSTGNAGTAQQIYIYGLAVDGIDTTTSDNTFVDLRISSFTSPNAVYGTSAYSWDVATMRFGTKTTLEKGTSTTVPTVVAGTVTSVDWTPYWGSAKNSLVSGQLVFMDLSFTVGNPIPEGGYIQVTVTEKLDDTTALNWAATSGADNCYVVTPIDRSVACSTGASGALTISKLPSVTGATSIKVRSVVKITSAAGATAQVSKIETFKSNGGTSGGNLIDTATNQGSFTLAAATNFVGLTNFDWYFHLNAATTPVVTTAGGKYTNSGALEDYNLQFEMTGTVAIKATSTVTIDCPFSSAVDDFNIYIPSPEYVWESTSVTGIAAAPGGTLTTDPQFTVATGSTLGTIKFTTDYKTGGSTLSTTVRLDIGTKNAAAPYLQLPRVAQNYATAYECRAAVRTDSIDYTGFVQLDISPNTWVTSTYSVPCSTYKYTIPLMIKIQPKVPMVATGSGKTYYVEVEITSTDLDAFVTPTAPVTTPRTHDPVNYALDYPYAKPGSIPTSAKFYIAGTKTFFLFSGFGDLGSTGTPSAEFYFPIGGASFALTTINPTVRSLYYTTDPRYAFISNEGTLTTVATITTPAYPASGTATAWDGNTFKTTEAINQSPLSSVVLDTFDATTIGAGNALAWFYVVLPAGWTITAPSVKIGASTMTKVYSFSLPTATFKYPGLLFSNYLTSGTTQALNTATGNAAGTLTFTGLTSALGVNNAAKFVVAAGVLDAACTSIGETDSFNSKAGTITNVSVTPTTIKQRGADGVGISHTVSFTLTHTIPAGGTIAMTFDPSWGLGYTANGSCTYCTATGVTAAAGYACTIGTNTVTLSGFAAITATSAPISITVNGLLAPTSATAANATGTQFVQNIYTYLTGTTVIDSITSITTTAVSISLTSDKGKATWSKVQTYPSTAGTKNVDLYLKFSLAHSLPACGSIVITSQQALKGTDIKNQCFVSPLKSSTCTLSAGTITVTLGPKEPISTAGTTLELYLDSMVDNPDTTTSTSGGFQVTTSWGGTTVDQDPSTFVTEQQITASKVPTDSISGSSTASSLSFYPKNAGELATYVFDFKDTAKFEPTDSYRIVFPSQFDYFIGNSWTSLSKEDETSKFYLDCSSTQLGTTWCLADHNILIVTGSNSINGNAPIVITVNNVVNPAASQTSAFEIYHVDSTGNYVAVNQNYGTVTPVAVVGADIGVRSLVMTESRLFKSSDYTWRLYITDTMNTDSQLQVMFPQEYNLRLFDKKDTYSCSTSYLDISASATIKSQQSWNSAASCTATNNVVTLSAPTASPSFTNTKIVTFTVQSVGNPQFALTRSAPTLQDQDFDVTDGVLWPLWTYWTSKFTFFVYRSTAANLMYTSRSYPNMNAAYANLYDGYRQILVNGYKPDTKSNRIVVYAGTQTVDMLITTYSTALPMAAKQIVFTPTTNSRTPDGGKLKYTSVADEWTLFQSFYSIKFRVCAAIDTTKGLYYIDWSNNETKQTGQNDVQYDIPASTLVEVVAKTAGKYTFAVSTIPSIATGFTSVPIKISITNAPCSDVTVNIAVQDAPANISVTPTALTFSQDVTTRHFQIQVASNYDLTQGTVRTLKFELTGTDKEAYTISASTKFTVTQATTSPVPGNIASWGLGQPTKTTNTASPSSDQTGVIYYHLAAAGTTVPSYSTLKASITSLINQNGTNSEDGKDPGANNESDPKDGESWVEFQRRLYKQHLSSEWVGAVSMYVTTNPSPSLSFTWLWASTNYQISGYLDNLGSTTTTPIVKTEFFTTTATADSQPVALKFTGQVAQSFGTKISSEYANYIGVNPSRLIGETYKTETGRLLADTTTITSSTFGYTLLVNRFSEVPSPTDQAKVTGTAVTELNTRLAASGIPQPLNKVDNLAIPSHASVSWTTNPTSGGSTINSVTVNLRSNTAGQSCCVALTGSSTAPTAEQVMLSLDASNTAVSGSCITTDLTTSTNAVQVSGLQASTAYYVYCTASDDYPLWPQYIPYSSTSPMTPVPITTLSSTVTTDTGASYLGGLLALLVVFY